MPELAGQQGDSASASAPGTTSTDIEKVRADLSAELDKRIAGFQRLVSQRDEALAAKDAELEELRLASLPEEEREQHLVSRKDRRIQELEAQLELNALAGDYGTELPYFQRLLAGSTAKEQLDVMREFASQFKAPAQVTEEPAFDADDPEIPDVDSNRPLRSPSLGGVVLPDGTVMTEQLADQILNSIPGPQSGLTQRRFRPSN